MIFIEEEDALYEILHLFNGDKIEGPDDVEITQQLFAQMMGWTE